MKTLFCFLIFFVFTIRCVQSQNAFYDAKKLSKWMLLDDSTKQSNAPEYYAILMSYGKPDKLMKSGIKGVYNDVVNAYLIKAIAATDIEVIFKKALQKYPIIGFLPLKEMVKKYQDDTLMLKEFRDASAVHLTWLKQISPDITTTDVNFTKFLTFIQKTDSSFRDSITGNANANSQTFLNSIIERNEKVLRLYAELIGKKEADILSKISEDKLAIPELFRQAPDSIRINIFGSEAANQELRKKAELHQQQWKANISKSQNRVEVDKYEQTEGYVKTSISDQNFPSQSEIIDALAIYISKRFKEEVAYTFLEGFTKYLKNNVLAYELFPTTFSLLNQQDPYSMPRLGSEWKNAVSTDLLKLPENLVNSSLIKKWINNDTSINYISDAVLIGKYIAKKYSYVDMIRSLYERNGIEDENEVLKSSYIKRGVLVSYILNQEFFDSSKSKFWITPEELYRLDNRQLEILGELLYEKYDTAFITNFGFNPLVASDSYAKLKTKYTDLLATFKQFENSQVAAYQSNKEGGNLKDAFWDFQRILVDFIVKEVKNEESKASIKNVQKIFYVYDYLSSKNYGAAINTTLDVLDTLLQKKSPSRYLRAIVGEKAIAEIEKLTLNPTANGNVVGYLNEMEVLAKIQSIIAKADDSQRNLEYVKAAYKNISGRDLSNDFREENLRTLLEPGAAIIPKVDSLFSALQRLIVRNLGLALLSHIIYFYSFG